MRFRRCPGLIAALLSAVWVMQCGHAVGGQPAADFVLAIASVPPVWTLDDLEQIALGNNPTLAQAASRIEAERGQYVQAGLYPNPVVGYTGEEIGDEGRGGQQGAFFGQEIVTAGKLRLDRAVAGHEITMAQHDWDAQCLRVVNDVRAAAYDVLVAQQIVALNEQLVGVGQEGLKVAEDLLRAQEVSRVDVLQARIEANSARLQRDNARDEHAAAWRRLAAVVGVADLEPRPIDAPLDADAADLTWDDTLARLMAGSPELARAYAEAQRAECALARECAGRVPNVDVEAAVRYDHATDDTVAAVQFGLPLTLFDRNQGNIRRAEAELAAARQEIRRVELSLQHRLAETFRQYASAKEQVRRYRDEILPDAAASLDLVRQGYRQGEFGYLEQLTAQQTFFRVNLAHVEALRGVRTSAARIEGMLLAGGLDAPGP